MLEAGIKGEQSVEVVYENTATAVGSGVLEVFGTPCMLALMEKTASGKRKIAANVNRCIFRGI